MPKQDRKGSNPKVISTLLRMSIARADACDKALAVLPECIETLRSDPNWNEDHEAEVNSALARKVLARLAMAYWMWDWDEPLGAEANSVFAEKVLARYGIR